MGDFDSAITDYTTAIQLDPNDPDDLMPVRGAALRYYRSRLTKLSMTVRRR